MTHSHWWIPRLLTVLCLLQPVLDVFSYWCARWGVPACLTLAPRLAMLGFMVILSFRLCPRRKMYWLLTGWTAALVLGHLWAIGQQGIVDLFSDCTNLVRMLQLPWMTLSLLTCLQLHPEGKDGLLRGFCGSLWIILAVLLLAAITGTEPHTYEDGTGRLGWFQNTNAQSAIVSMVYPVALSRTRQTPAYFFPTLLGGGAALWLLGTRLAYLALLASLFGLAGVLLLSATRPWQQIAVLTGCGALCLLLLPQSPMARHQALYRDAQADRQAQINSSLSRFDLPPLDEEGLTDAERSARQALWTEALTPIYAKYAPNLVAQFGAEQTIALYDYTTDIKTITAARPQKLMFARLLMDESGPSARFFGLELGRFTVGDTIYDVENDFHGVYYLWGWAGLLSLLLFLGLFARCIPAALRRLTPELAALLLALGFALLHALFTAGVLRRPNSSFYLSAVLAALWESTSRTYTEK